MTMAAHRLSLSWVLDPADIEHAVYGEDMADSVAGDLGLYRALCGLRVHPAGLTATPAGTCVTCYAAVHVEPAEIQGRHRAE